MPPKKGKAKKSPRTSEDEVKIDEIDVQYNPDIIDNVLIDLKAQMDQRCNQIQKDSDFMATSIQQAFHLELIKLPSQVKQMSVKRFKEEFGNSIEAVARGAMVGTSTAFSRSSSISSSKNQNQNQNQNHHSMNQKSFQTPSHNRNVNSLVRNPKEGEIILSANGSPLGEFTTVKKAPKTENNSIVPPTPGCFVPLKNGAIIDIENMDEEDIENMSSENKQDTIFKVEAIMSTMGALMAKLNGNKV